MNLADKGSDGIAGKKIWMSGGANGIGRAVAEGLMNAMCGSLTIVDIVDEEEGQVICKRLARKGRAVLYYKCDVRDGSGILSCMSAAKREMRELDLVINNAGVVDEDSLERSMGVNVGGIVNGTEAAIRLGVRRVINMGSAAGVFGLPEAPYYAASKHAVVGYSRSIGAQLKERMKICCVCPGFIDAGIGVGRGWTDGGVGIMKVNEFVDFFVAVVRGDYGDTAAGRVLYVSEKLGGRQVNMGLAKL